MIKEKTLSRSVRLMFSGSVLMGLAAVTQPVVAQEAKIEAVVVTGTRISSPGTTSNSPIYSIGEAEIRSAQPVAVEEFFKSLPAAVPAIGPGTNNGTGGAATIDLRGLGSQRSLVLVNGRRFVPYDLSGTVDTNSIPIALISRTDLLTGGASVVYGADAVAGVVNFNLKKNFKGLELSTSYGGRSGGELIRQRTDLTIGASLDEGKGNVALSIGRTKSDPLFQGARDFGFTSLDSVTGLASGSGTTVPSAFSVGIGPGGTTALAGSWQIDPATGRLIQPVKAYNFNPTNYFATGLERTQATALANYKVNDYAEVYTEIFYTGSQVNSSLASSGTFNNVFQVPIGNPYIPAAARQQICERRGIPAANCVVGNATMVPMTIGRRITELGPRFNDFDNKTLQFTIGVKGDIAYDWKYDASWSRGEADQLQTRRNWGSLSKTRQALNALSLTSCVDPSNGCVPLNVWGAEGSITAAQIGFMNLSSLLRQNVMQDVAMLNFSGDLGDTLVSPWAKSPINMAFGLESRKMKASTKSDSASQIQGEVLGTGAPTPDRVGTFTLREAMVEASVPLIKDMPFVRNLGMELGYRHTEFENGPKSQSYGSYKYGGEWEPIKSVRLRGMIQKATRAPNINELYAPQTTGLSNLAVDPCQGNLISGSAANTAGTLSNLCRLTGVPVTEIGSLPAPSAGQINRLTGGNPDLGPEEAKTKTLGFVWEPMPKLALTLDYYKIDIERAITSPSTTDILDGCYKTTFNPSLTFNASCALIGRDPTNGTFNGAGSRGVATAQANLGKVNTSGFDIGAVYQLQMSQLGLAPSWGKLDLAFQMTVVKEFKSQPTPASINRDCLGYYSVACGGPTYERKFNQRTTWTMGDWNVGYNWRYVSGVRVEPLAGTFLPAFSKIDAYSYVDMSAVWNVTKNVRLNVSVVNAFDKRPPIVGSTIGSTGTNSGNTFPQYYDAIGRYVTLGANFKF